MDYHFLNSTLRNVVDAAMKGKIDSNTLRLIYRGKRNITNSRAVDTLGALFLEYTAPFPLTYVFGPRSLEVYNSIFVFVLQVRRAKYTLERILVRASALEVSGTKSEMKAVYVVRGRLSWVVKYVIFHPQQYKYLHKFQAH
jgi:gamma-tubulin complex component 5